MVTVAPLRHVVAATDLSEAAAVALTRAGRLAAEHGATLTALHVMETASTADLTDAARAALSVHVNAVADCAPTEVSVRRGRAAAEITAEAARSAADVVVVGDHGQRGLAEAFLGTTAENVVHMSPTPVLVAKVPATQRYERVILAVDTTAESAEAARFGCALTPAARHVVVHACTVVGENLLRMYGVDDAEVDRLRDVATGDARRYVAQLSETLTPRPHEVVVTTGHPPARLAELSRSRSTDLIVVGTGSRSPVSYAFLGSVAQHVLREARCDVLVVPSRAESASSGTDTPALVGGE